MADLFDEVTLDEPASTEGGDIFDSVAEAPDLAHEEKGQRLRKELQDVRSSNRFARFLAEDKPLLNIRLPGSQMAAALASPIGSTIQPQPAAPALQPLARGVTAAGETLAGGVSEMTRPTTLPALAAGFVPGGPEALGIYFGGQMAGAGAGELSVGLQQGEPETIGRGVAGLALGAPIAVAGARSRAPFIRLPLSLRAAEEAVPATTAEEILGKPTETEVPSVLQKPEAETVLRDVPEQPPVGSGEVPAETSAEGVPRGEQAKEATGGAEVLLSQEDEDWPTIGPAVVEQVRRNEGDEAANTVAALHGLGIETIDTHGSPGKPFAIRLVQPWDSLPPEVQAKILKLGKVEVSNAMVLDPENPIGNTTVLFDKDVSKELAGPVSASISPTIEALRREQEQLAGMPVTDETLARSKQITEELKALESEKPKDETEKPAQSTAPVHSDALELGESKLPWNLKTWDAQWSAMRPIIESTREILSKLPESYYRQVLEKHENAQDVIHGSETHTEKWPDVVRLRDEALKILAEKVNPIRKIEPKVDVGGQFGSVGPGAKTPGEPPYAAIQQLTDQLNATPAVGAKERISIGERKADAWAKGKNLADRATARLRNISETLKGIARGVRTVQDIDRNVGEFDFALQKSSAESIKAKKALERQMPNAMDREASAVLIDAGGDTALIREALDKLPETVSPRLRRVLERAANPSKEMVQFGESLKQFFGIREQDAQAADLFEDGLRNYYTHIWEKEENMPDSLRGALASGRVNTYFQYARERKIPTIIEGILQGKKPILDPAKVVPFYNYSMDRAIASRELIKQLTELKAKDGRPLVEAAGVGKLVEGTESGDPAIFIKPKLVAEDIKDYRPVDHPALRKWKWATKTQDGTPIFLQGDLLVHPEAYERVARMMARDRLTPSDAMRVALRLGTEVKGFKLGLLSAFHQVHVASHAAWHWTNPFRAGEIDWEAPETKFAVEKGHLKLAPNPAELSMFAEGIIGPGLVQKIPVIGPWSKAYSQWLFGDFIPRLKLKTFENAYERNTKAYAKDLASGKLTQEELASRVGDSVNNAYGELNQLFLGKSGRDPRVQRLLRTIFLAPDFGEARLRFVEKAFTKYGHEERLALATMALTLYFGARIANWLSHGDPELDPKRAFQVKSGEHWWSMRSVAGDVVHAIDKPGQFTYVRLNPLYSRTLADFIFGRDVGTGKKLDGPQKIERLAQQVVPIQLSGATRPDQKLWESFVTAMGVSATRDTPEQDIHKLAQDWRLKKGLEPTAEFIPTDAPSYQKLRQAIRIGSLGHAESLLQDLRKTHSDKQIEHAMALYVDHPFTGSNDHEREFLAGLSAEQKRLYLKARQEQMKDLTEFYRLLAKPPKK